MGDMGDLYRAFKEDKKELRQENLKNANDDGWNKFTEDHWYRDIKGKRLDYYPSTGKFKYDGQWRCCGVGRFIQKLEGK